MKFGHVGIKYEFIFFWLWYLQWKNLKRPISFLGVTHHLHFFTKEQLTVELTWILFPFPENSNIIPFIKNI